MRGSVAIAGVGLAGCGEAPAWSEIEIAAAAAKNALADAGLTTRDVNGLVIASTNIFMSGLALAEHLGIRPRFTESSMVGGSSFVGHLIPAALALEAGLCDVVLDAAYLQYPFPSSWCSYALPDNVARGMLDTWRSEVSQVWPELDDDAVLMPRLFEAELLWVWVSTWWFLPRAGENDRPVDLQMPSPRRSTALVDRWRHVRSSAEGAEMGDLAEFAGAVVDVDPQSL